MTTVFLNFPTESFALTRTPVSNSHVNRETSNQNWRDDIPASTDLVVFRNQRVLCIVDGDNWNISAKNRGLHVRYDRMLASLRQQARQIFPVAVITSNPGDNRYEDALTRFGWHVVSIPREPVFTGNGMKTIANADADLCFELGVLSSVANCTTALIGTGDGNLAISCAAGLKRTFRKRPISVHTLSIGGATSARLRSRRDLFASSILLGMDLLAPEAADCPHIPSTRKGGCDAY